jgi:hypothetical protein
VIILAFAIAIGVLPLLPLPRPLPVLPNGTSNSDFTFKDPDPGEDEDTESVIEESGPRIGPRKKRAYNDRFAASCLAVVRRLVEDETMEVVADEVVGVAEPDASVPLLGGLLDKMPVDVRSS